MYIWFFSYADGLLSAFFLQSALRHSNTDSFDAEFSDDSSDSDVEGDKEQVCEYLRLNVYKGPFCFHLVLKSFTTTQDFPDFKSIIVV